MSCQDGGGSSRRSRHAETSNITAQLKTEQQPKDCSGGKGCWQKQHPYYHGSSHHRRIEDFYHFYKYIEHAPRDSQGIHSKNAAMFLTQEVLAHKDQLQK